MSIPQDIRDRQKRLVHALYTETALTVTKISVEVGVEKNMIWLWARENAWVRPPKTFGDWPDISPAEYRRRFMKELGLPQPDHSPKRSAKKEKPVKDPFDLTQRAADEDAKKARHAQREAIEARILELWGDGLDASTISQRVRYSEDRVRRVLKRLGADLKAPRRMPVRGFGSLRSSVSPRARAGDWQRRT